MRLNRKTAPGFRNCKIKPVDPAFRSVSLRGSQRTYT